MIKSKKLVYGILAVVVPVAVIGLFVLNKFTPAQPSGITPTPTSKISPAPAQGTVCGWCGRTCVQYPISEEGCKTAGGIFMKQCACPEVVPPEDSICIEESGECVQKPKPVLVSCENDLDCPEKMKCDNFICVDVGCLGEGKVIPSTAVSPEGFEERKHIATECCKGLEGIPTLNRYDENCNWEPPPPGVQGGGTVCSKCGNGICEEWESGCNCPEDCK